jgi:hypothetical protein
MRTMLVGLAVMGAGGTAFWAGSSGPDFDRQIARRPAEVYAAFSALGPAGVTTSPSEGGMPSMTRRVVKVPGESIQLEILLENRPVLDVELNFEPGEDGNGTRLTAELDVDAYELGSAFETEAGMALSMVPDSYLDAQFANFMGDMADDIAAGRPLPPLGLGRSGLQRKRSTPRSLEGRRSQARAEQRAASRPMVRAAPMVDPDAAARAHLRGD